jgi:glycerol-3-phosphate acyltransferase PlsX
MGGGAGPGPIVAGAARAVRADKHLRLTVVGEQSAIEYALLACDGHHPRLHIFPACQTIPPDANLTTEFRLKPDSSVARLWQLWVEQKVEAVIGTGSAEAFAAAGLRHRRLLTGVRMPGLAAFISTLRGPCLLIDVAANAHPTPDELFQYGAMGVVFVRQIYGRDNPSVGLLSAGPMDLERHESSRQVIALFQHSHLAGQFCGRLDAQDLHRGPADVLVCERSLGSFVFKLWQGMNDFAGKMPLERVATNPAPLAGPYLGMDKVCLWCADAVTPNAVESALAQVARHFELGLNEQIVKELEAGPLVRRG